MPNNLCLTNILASAWQLLASGCADPQHGCHWPVLASTAADGAPDARTVVLRALDTDRRTLQIHSDAQAGKLAQLRRDPRVCLVFYDGPARTQLRVHGAASLHLDDPVANAAWARLPAHSRALYDGRSRFAVLMVAVRQIDWLLLDPAGHQRAGFVWPDGLLQAGWLTP